jgi:hypothetical protein
VNPRPPLRVSVRRMKLWDLHCNLPPLLYSVAPAIGRSHSQPPACLQGGTLIPVLPLRLRHALPPRRPAPRRCRPPLTPAPAEQLPPLFLPPGESPKMTLSTYIIRPSSTPNIFGRQGFWHLCSVADSPCRTCCVLTTSGSEDESHDTSDCRERPPVALTLQPLPAAATAPAHCLLPVPRPAPLPAAAAGHPPGPLPQPLSPRPRPWQLHRQLPPPLPPTPAAAAAPPPACNPQISFQF